MTVEEVFAKREELARLGQQITELAGHLNAGEYRFLVLVEAFDRYLVNLHTDIETLKADGDGAEANLEDRSRVPAETSRRPSGGRAPGKTYADACVMASLDKTRITE